MAQGKYLITFYFELALNQFFWRKKGMHSVKKKAVHTIDDNLLLFCRLIRQWANNILSGVLARLTMH